MVWGTTLEIGVDIHISLLDVVWPADVEWPRVKIRVDLPDRRSLDLDVLCNDNLLLKSDSRV